jgi:hypothetical protein
MNDFDRDNFLWFTNASAQELEQWYAQADIADLSYMLKLIELEITNLRIKQLDEMEQHLDYYQDQAVNVINFVRKGK